MTTTLDREELRKYWNEHVPGAGDVFFALLDDETWAADRLHVPGSRSWQDDAQIVLQLEAIARRFESDAPRLLREFLFSDGRIVDLVDLLGYLSTIRSLRLMEIAGADASVMASLFEVALRRIDEGDQAADAFSRRMVFLDQIRFLDQFFDRAAVSDALAVLRQCEEEQES